MAKKKSTDDMGFGPSDNTGADGEMMPASSPRNTGDIVKSFLALALIGVFTVFAIQNTESTRVEFLAWEFNLSLILLILLSAAVGFTVFVLGSFVRRRRKTSSYD
jgi:uncharacterized integral membrane protein